MPVLGVGIDVVDVERFRAVTARTPGVLARLLLPGERALPPASQAARFAAKEAVAKALGAPAGLRWHDAEVVREEGGRPRLEVRGTVAAAAAALGVTGWHLSLAHDAGIATAMVVAEGEPR